MLRTKINKGQMKTEMISLDVISTACTYSHSGNTMIIPTDNNLNIRVGNTVYVVRKDGSDIDYRLACTVLSSTTSSITVNYDYTNTLIPVNLWKTTDLTLPMASTEDFLTLQFNAHYFRKNRDNLVVERLLDSGYTFGQSVIACLDYRNFIFNDRYLYKSKKKDGNGDFVIESALCENYKDIVFTDESGNTISDGIVPMDGFSDSKRLIYFPWDSSYQQMVNDSVRLTYAFNDPRFFDIDSGGTVSFKDGVDIQFERYPMLQIGLGQALTPNISIGEDICDNYLEERIEKGINKIIDYEKKMFEPVYLTNTLFTGTTFTAHDIDTIKFNLYFRDRKITDDWSDWVIREPSEWTGSTSIPIWNRDRYATGTTQPLYGDPLGVIGFDDNDVYNRNKRLAKSFIRLSFFDSPDRKKQVLQFYSTIFFDTTEMYDRFMRNRNDEVTGKTSTNNYVDLVQTDEKYSLSCSFSCSGKKEATKSSEGFYLYLYDSLLEGAKPTPLYMLVEFNHALFGKTIPMMMPISNTASGLTPINFLDTTFPYDYQASGTTVGSITPLHIDMTRFYNDLFIKVYVKYDNVGKRYIWYLPQKMDSNILTFNLYEPNLNPIRGPQN